HTAGVSHASWSPDGSRIVTVSRDKSVRLWDATSGVGLTLLEVQEGIPAYSEWSRSGNGLLVVHPRGVYVWDYSPEPEVLESLSLRLIFDEHTDTLTYATWSPDGRRILSIGDDGAHIWDAQDGRQLVQLPEGASGAPHAAWSPDGTRILTTGDTVRIWDAETGRTLLVLSGHYGPVDFAAWDATGTLILSASWDTIARVWDAFSGKTLAVVSGYFDSMRHAVWSPDNTQFVTTSWGGPVRVFDVPLGESPEMACVIAVRNLTVEEWEAYLVDQPYRRTCPNLP
ncbi:MAG: WD40 repeat domain-containing protein, partial [Anaerolineae bacterium]